MARMTGFEPAASGVTGRRSKPLSYTRAGVDSWGLWHESNSFARNAGASREAQATGVRIGGASLTSSQYIPMCSTISE